MDQFTPIRVKVLLTSIIWTEYKTAGGKILRIKGNPEWKRHGDTGTLVRQGAGFLFRPDRRSRRLMRARKQYLKTRSRELEVYRTRISKTINKFGGLHAVKVSTPQSSESDPWG